ncbi:MAG: hypothetical protein GYB55_10250 [Cytophagales bacterium]|nr:hypothetical protein [Cytophagales bacterium]|tara:strand:- start:40857 stop:41276 length:420 start_codon:yes stop_codon:yes gene_type:complete
MRIKTNEATKQEVKRLAKKGLGYKKIAKATGLKQTTARYWLRKLRPKTAKEKRKGQLKTFEMMYKRGLMINEIAEKMGVCWLTAHLMKKELSGLKTYKRDKAIELFNKGVSLNDISIFLKISRSYALRLTKECREIQQN